MNRAIFRGWFAALALVVFSVFPRMAVASQAETDLANMLAEVDTLTAEQKKMPQKVNDNLSLKAKHEQAYKRISDARANLAPEESAIEAARPGVASLCSGTVPEDQYSAAVARCEAVLNPLNARIAALKRKHEDLNREVGEIDVEENARVAEAKVLIDRNTAIESRLNLLRASIKMTRRMVCVERCITADDNGTCLADCYDGSRSSQRPKIPDPPRPSPNTVPGPATPSASGGTTAAMPVFTAAPNRTPEQAIEEYKNSGREKPPAPPPSAAPPPPSSTP